MLQFLANNLEQLDLALEHISQGDANNARFGLMLTDNAVEITLHQLAKDKQSEMKFFTRRREEFQHHTELEEALGRRFDAKLKFAKLLGAVSDETAETIAICHSFRNEVYHIGIQHEAVLPELAAFYFTVSCGFLAGYSPMGLSWGSNQTLPERAKKFFRGDSHFPGSLEDYRAACATLADDAGFVPAEFIAVLADHMDQVIEETDTAIEMIATGAPNPSSRDEVVIGSQTWPLAFSEDGKKFMAKNGWKGGSVFQLVDWLAENFPLAFRGDPIPSWRTRAESIRTEANPHAALNKYRNFMDQTAVLRESIDEAARQVDEYIDGQIERALLERQR